MLTRLVLNVSSAFAREVLEPEVAQRQERRPVPNQQELIAMYEKQMYEDQLAVLDMQSPNGFMRRYLNSEATKRDKGELRAVRQELSGYGSPSMEPQGLVQQQPIETSSAITVPQTIEGVQAELNAIAQPMQASGE